MSAVAMIGFGQVRHTRLRPLKHAFAYPTYFLMLPMRSLCQAAKPADGPWRINRPGAMSFFDSDHGDGRGAQAGGALAWLDELLRREGIADASGEVWLHCYPRVLGHTFKPVSFWYCHRAAHDRGGALRAIVVEVNNTFGERHCYLLDEPRFGVEQRANKVFHVSPFCRVEGHYRFRFMRTGRQGREQTVARIDFCDDAGVLLQTSVSGTLEPITRTSLRRALWRHPAMTLGVVLHIHSQALRLWLKRLPFFRKPAAPDTFVTR
ncbi:MAG: DUF1365 domain-containing protein [Rhodoferax sp.]